MPDITDAGARSASVPFTGGNIVVCRVGDGTAVLGSSAAPVFLDEFSSSGNLVQSIPMPRTVSGTNLMLTNSGAVNNECQITRSADAKLIVVTGYNAPVGKISVSTTNASTFSRVIARVGADGAVDTSTSTTSINGIIRSATSDDGVNVWAVGSTGGVVYTTAGSNGAATTVSTTVTDNRFVNIFGGQLYASNNTASTVRVGTVGTGLPIIAGQTITGLSGLPVSGSPNGFLLADLSPSVPGLDTLYIADEGTGSGANGGGVKKLSLVSGTWTYNGTFPANGVTIPATLFVGLTGSVNGGTVSLFATRTPGSDSQLVSFVDATGYNAVPTAIPTLLATGEPYRTAFRGIALTPVAPPVVVVDTASTGFNGDFGSVTVGGSSATRSYKVSGTNVSSEIQVNAPAGFEVSSSPGGPFTASINVSGTGTVAPTDVFVRFHPVGAGAATGFVTNSSSGASTVDVAVTGTGTQPGTIDFEHATYSQNESGGAASITLKRTGGSDGIVSVQVTLSNGTANGGTACAAGVDYVNAGSPFTVNFANGQTTANISVPICNDSLWEPGEPESVNLSLGNATGGPSIGAQSTAVLYIVDDDSPPDTTIDASPKALSNSSSATFTFGGNATALGIAGFDCSLDGGAFESCVSPKVYVGLTDGSHTFQVRAVDTATNVDPTPANFAWFIDTISPVIADYPFLSHTTSTDPRTFSVKVTDDNSVNDLKLHYSVGGGANDATICTLGSTTDEWLCSTPGVPPGNAVAYYIQATDLAGNSAQSPSPIEPNLFTVGASAVPSGNYRDASLSEGSTLEGSMVISRALDLGGLVTTGSNTVELGCLANVTGAGETKYLVGKLKKNFCEAGGFLFPVGENGFAPVAVNITDLGQVPASLTVRSYDTWLTGFDPAQALSRNWLIDETGDLTADISFRYTAADVNGDEGNYRLWRVEPGVSITNMCPAGPCASDGVLGPAVGVKEFSRWTGSGLLAPTAAAASISGRVVTADGRSVADAFITVEGGNLSEPITVITDSSGYYKVSELESGQFYFVSVSSNFYRFTPSVRGVGLLEDTVGLDFKADQ